jgi:hypothetical protein
MYLRYSTEYMDQGAFIWSGIQSILPETLEYLSDMFLVIPEVVRVNEDVIEVADNGDVQEVQENVIHKMLKGGQSI